MNTSYILNLHSVNILVCQSYVNVGQTSIRENSVNWRQAIKEWHLYWSPGRVGGGGGKWKRTNIKAIFKENSPEIDKDLNVHTERRIESTTSINNRIYLLLKWDLFKRTICWNIKHIWLKKNQDLKYYSLYFLTTIKLILKPTTKTQLEKNTTFEIQVYILNNLWKKNHWKWENTLNWMKLAY